MGGHGGLNILPQKRWNVYGRENRLKVAQDEAAAAEKERQAAELHAQAERDFKRQLLLERAKGKYGAPDRSDSMLGPGGHDDIVAPTEATTTNVPLEDPEAQSILQHIQFFRKAGPDRQGGNPEAEEERRRESAKRGKTDTQTSDAKFDQRFQLAHGLYGKGSQPWYVQEPPPVREMDREGSAAMRLEYASLRQGTAGIASGSLLLVSGSKGDAVPGQHTDDDNQRHSRKHKQKDKHKHKHKDRKKDKGHKANGGVAKKSIDQLRAERIAREEAERQRQKRLMHHVLTEGGQPLGKRYHNSYGNAAP